VERPFERALQSIILGGSQIELGSYDTVVANGARQGTCRLNHAANG